MYVFTYTPIEKLTPDTVRREAFEVISEDGAITPELAVYYPDKNSIKLIFNDDLYLKQLHISSSGLKTLAGAAADCDIVGYAECTLPVVHDGISIIGTGFYQNGVPIRTLAGKINVDIRITIANTSGTAYKNAAIIIRDKNGFDVFAGNIDICEYGIAELWISSVNYVFCDNDLSFIVEAGKK